MKRGFFIAAGLLLLWAGCKKSPAPETASPGFSLILRMTPQATRAWLWDTTGVPITTAELTIAGTPLPYVPDSGCYFRAQGVPAGPQFLLEVRGVSDQPWLYEIQPPFFRSTLILNPSQGDVFPKNADLWVYWILDGEATRGTHQLVARYEDEIEPVYQSDSLAASQTFWPIPGTVLNREGDLQIQVFSGMYRRLDLPDPPAHPDLPRALDFGGSYVAIVYADSVTVSIGYPGTEVEVWRGWLQGRGQGAWNRVDSLFQVVLSWQDTTEFFERYLTWPPAGDTLLGPFGDSLVLMVDTLWADSVRGWYRLWGTRSDSGAWWGAPVP